MQVYTTVLALIGVVGMSALASDVQQLPVKTIENLEQDLRSLVDDTNNLSTDGYEVRTGQFPYHAQLYIKNDVESSTTLAAGSLITPNYILTHANALSRSINSYNSTHGYAVLGMDDRRSIETQQQINFTQVGVQLHPNRDIATIRLDHPVTFTKFVQAIRLPSLSDSRTYEMMEGTNVGSYWSPSRYLRNQIMANDDCNEQHPHASIYSYNICTNTYVGGAFCTRMYGSGLIVQDENGPILVGVTTLVFACAVNYPNVYLRVSDFRDWISVNSDYVFDF
ncbi:chymotrypsin-2-like [Anopheles moucheti]|uniref:chymotrypsin-2-like n=1 Tax=Anopheles moucheti TaxID=186751 RepID=UPI0022F076C6|nr:chymotrypsin-2-like [Anopheles moucheti]